MKTPVKALLIMCGTILSLWIIGRITKTFEFNHAVTSANAPAIKKGDYFFSSVLVKPKRFNFICFYIVRPELTGKQINFFRLCGLPGDIVEIRDGNLYVNNESADDHLRLQHDYRIARSDFEKIKDSLLFDKEFIADQTEDTLLVPMEDAFVQRNTIHARRLVLPTEFNEASITVSFSSDWNQDHFGPIKVPENKYFALGDNRHDASDSRFVGFIDKSDFAGTILWKK